MRIPNRIARKKQTKKKGGKSTFEEVVPLQMRERESGERRGG